MPPRESSRGRASEQHTQPNPATELQPFSPTAPNRSKAHVRKSESRRKRTRIVRALVSDWPRIDQGSRLRAHCNGNVGRARGATDSDPHRHFVSRSGSVRNEQVDLIESHEIGARPEKRTCAACRPLSQWRFGPWCSVGARAAPVCVAGDYGAESVYVQRHDATNRGRLILRPAIAPSACANEPPTTSSVGASFTLTATARVPIRENCRRGLTNRAPSTGSLCD